MLASSSGTSGGTKGFDKINTDQDVIELPCLIRIK